VCGVADETVPSPLFAGPARWGYKYVEPALGEQRPEHDDPPQLEQVRKIPRAQATGLLRAAVIATAGAVGSLTADSALRAFSIGAAKGTPTEVAVILASLLAAIVAFWFVGVWQRATAEARRTLAPALVVLVCFFLPYLVLSAEAVVAWRRIWQERDDRVPDPVEAKRAEAQYQQATSEWEQRIEQHAATVDSEREAKDRWYPVPFSETPHTTCLFGEVSSWPGALVTLGASLLSSGNRIIIVDRSRRLLADRLCDLSRGAGFPVTEAVFRGSAAEADVFDDLNLVEDRRASLTVVGVDKQAEDAERDRCAGLLFRELLSLVRDGRAQADVLTILGADRVGRDNLESLMDHAADRRIRVLLFFERLRPDGVEIMGAGGAATAFFALGNYQDALEASRFLGDKRQWIETQRTVSEGESHTRTEGSERTTSASATVGLPLVVSGGMSVADTLSHSEASAESVERTRAEQFVPSAVVELEVLKMLPLNEMIYVEAHTGGQADTRVNCDPRIAFCPRAADEPHRAEAPNESLDASR
jgi:hypothetical protein